MSARVQLGGIAAATTLLSLLTAVPVIAGDYAVTISGDEGTSFGGTCLLMTANEYAKRQASGIVPLTLNFTGDLISCAIQKKTGTGHLRIVIRRAGGEIVADSSQEQPFGVVLAAGR